jgi:hypothetical protein
MTQELWHLQEPTNPDRSLCGIDLTGIPNIPGPEIPEENRCQECLRAREERKL